MDERGRKVKSIHHCPAPLVTRPDLDPDGAGPVVFLGENFRFAEGGRRAKDRR
ncbi:MAG TPA: hypothetical protein VMN36_04040 [Verrucomicrobiales bacterium]|nr:hypothetical protein [Verrucomicrobiales bacterium]